jgi:hypothetical protein
MIIYIWYIDCNFRLRCLNIAWTELTCESVQHLCEALPRCIEQLNISGQRYNLTDDCNYFFREKRIFSLF